MHKKEVEYRHEAQEKQHERLEELKQRIQKKKEKEREISEHNYKSALREFHSTQRIGGRGTFITESPDARSQGSRTHSNFFGKQGGSMFRSTLNAEESQAIE